MLGKSEVKNFFGGSSNTFLGSLFVQLGAVTNAGGSNIGTEQCNGVSVDTSGNIYCAGQTGGGMSEANAGSNDAFVMKMNSSGTILWHTQFGAVTNAGGTNVNDNVCFSVTVDTSGNVYCAGHTIGGMSEASGGSFDAFILKLDSNGNLVWHTQLGGTTNAGGSNAGADKCLGVAVDSSGNVYCSGQTTGAMSEANGGGDDAFVMKLDSSGNVLWHTQLGGTTNAGGSNAGNDRCVAVSVDASGNVYCAGNTDGAMSEAFGGGVTDAFIMKLNSSGTILWHTQLGGTTNAGGSNAGADYCTGVAVDSSGNVYCAGNTGGAMSEANSGSQDSFVMKLDSSGNILWFTQLGAVTNAGGSNAGNDQCKGVAVDSSSNVYCGGHTSGAMSEANAGSNDAFIMKLDSSGNIIWHTQLGGVTSAGGSNTGNDYCYGVAVDNLGNAYCAGFTGGGMSEVNGGANDIFIMRVESDGNFNP